MRTRRRVLLVGVAGALGLVAILWWLTRPSPFQEAYNGIPVGLPAPDAERRLAGLPPPSEPPRFALAIASMDWQGETDDGVRDIHVDSDDEAEADPVLRRSRMWKTPWPIEPERTRSGSVYYHRETGAVLVRSVWNDDRECITVIYEQGRVVERAFAVNRVRPWWRRGWDFVADRLPF
jgi:hypothetical protein